MVQIMFPSKQLLSIEQEKQLVEAIDKAEENNKGEVRVHLEKKCPTADALDRAEQLFFDLGMHHTEEGTAALLYISIQSKKAAIYAGPGLYKSRQEDFWSAAIEKVVEGFKRNEPIEGIANALKEIGDVLREIVPGESENQLPNEVSTS